MGGIWIIARKEDLRVVVKIRIWLTSENRSCGSNAPKNGPKSMKKDKDIVKSMQ